MEQYYKFIETKLAYKKEYRPEQFMLVPDSVSWHAFRNEHVRMRVKVYYGISFQGEML
jgi:hypothetical protein